MRAKSATEGSHRNVRLILGHDRDQRISGESGLDL